MEIIIKPTKEELGVEAAKHAAELLINAIKTKGQARFVAATGASQFDFLTNLIKNKEIQWDKTEMFHLDEYVGLPESHIASFRKYLKERFISKVNPGKVHLIEGDAENTEEEIKRINSIIGTGPIDVAFVGIGENGHLAFNDPPADFDIEDPFILVELDEFCRKQQVGEGWFKSVAEVPTHAISMSIKQIMKAEHIICTIPDLRKAEAVNNCLSVDKPITNMHPASILKEHKSVKVFLDKDSASLLKQ